MMTLPLVSVLLQPNAQLPMELHYPGKVILPKSKHIKSYACEANTFSVHLKCCYADLVKCIYSMREKSASLLKSN